MTSRLASLLLLAVATGALGAKVSASWSAPQTSRVPNIGQVLGVLEDIPPTYVGAKQAFGVRVVFEKKGSQWRPFPSRWNDVDSLREASNRYPAEVRWTVGFDGRTLGQLTGRTPGDFAFYSHVGLQDIPPESIVPTVGKPSQEFGGWTGSAAYRPLVANSQPYFRDPDAWKPSPLSPQALASFRAAFRRQSPALCKANKDDETKIEPYPYRDQTVQLVKAYVSNRRWALARLHLAEAIECDDVGRGWEMSDRWFVADPQGAVRYIGEGMWLVDAGDYDDDGKSELLFSIDRYNLGGYELFYDDFHGHAVFDFSYH